MQHLKDQLRTTKLLTFKFQNGLSITSGVGMTMLKNMDDEIQVIRLRFDGAISSRGYYMKLTEAARRLEKYDYEVDRTLLAIAKYRWTLNQ